MNWASIFIVIGLVLLSGLFSGLTLGLLSLDKTDLERKIKVGNRSARIVYSVRKKGNLLLCTLLLGNVAVNSAIAIFLGNISSGIIAGLVSTGLITIFGEIVPQATVSRYALQVGAKTTWLVKFFMVVFFPITWPIAKILDLALGEELPTVWSKNELEEIVKLHRKSNRSDLDADEERIILGAMSYSEKTVDDIMTPRKVVFKLKGDQLLDSKLIKRIKNSGFTRIPVTGKDMDDIVGVLFSKDLIGYRGKTEVKKMVRGNSFFKVSDEDNLDYVLNKFLEGKHHLAVVYNKYGEFVGVVTLEDVIEEVFNREIVDESDVVTDTRKLVKKK